MEVMNAPLTEKHWHSMRLDLQDYMPAIRDNGLLMCCACGRFLTQDKFSLEHIIPKQALADDPPEAKRLFTLAQRAGTILLCKAPLKINGKIYYENGCNSWKGRHYDKTIREILNGRAISRAVKRIMPAHSIGLISLCYLAMVAHFGFQIALTQSGKLLRQQFFMPLRYHPSMPAVCQLTLIGGVPDFEETEPEYWSNPVSFDFEPGLCRANFRNVVVNLPVSRDPKTPIVRHLPIKPSKFTLRPDFSTAFD